MLMTILSVVALLIPETASEEDLRLSRYPFETPQWFSVSLAGQKVGYARDEFTREEFEGTKAIRINRTLSVSMVSMGAEVSLSFDSSWFFRNNAPYDFLRFQGVNQSNGEKESLEFWPEDDSLKVRVQSEGSVRELTIEEKPHTFFDQFPESWWALDPEREKGDQVSVRRLNETSHEFEEVRLTFNESLDSPPRKRIEVFSPEDGLATIDVDLSGILVETDAGGTNLSLTTEELAKEEGSKADVFEQMALKLDRFPGNAAEIQGMVLEIGKILAEILKDDSHQRVVKDEGRYLLKLGPKYGVPQKVTEEESIEELKETILYPINHPTVQTIVEQLAPIKDTRTKVEALCEAVHLMLEYDPGAEPINVASTLERGRGDCSEFSELFTTIARAAGIPARTLGGFVFMDEPSLRFGLHAWNEVAIDGYWHPVDSTWNEPQINATHVSLGTDTAALVEITGLGVVDVKLIATNPDIRGDTYDRSHRPKSLDKKLLPFEAPWVYRLSVEGTPLLTQEIRAREETLEGTPYIVIELKTMDEEGNPSIIERQFYQAQAPWRFTRFQYELVDEASIHGIMTDDALELSYPPSEEVVALSSPFQYSLLDSLALGSWLSKRPRKEGDSVELPWLAEEDWSVFPMRFEIVAIQRSEDESAIAYEFKATSKIGTHQFIANVNGQRLKTVDEEGYSWERVSDSK